MITNARNEDAKGMFGVESACFPPTEAATLHAIEKRIELFPEICLVYRIKGEIIGFINGAFSKFDTISDDFFEDMKNDQGENVLIFSLGVHPDHQRNGYAREILNTFIEQCKVLKKKKIILTCKEHKVNYYASFGFKNDGVAESTHGGAKWYSMSMTI